MSRALQQTLAEEKRKRKLKKADIARTLEVDRATITRQIQGEQNITVFRVGELASAMGRIPVISLVEPAAPVGSNLVPVVNIRATTTSAEEAANVRTNLVQASAHSS